MEEYTIFFGFHQRFLLRLHKEQSSLLLKSPVVDLNNIFGCFLKPVNSVGYFNVRNHYRLSYGGISVYCILPSVLIYANSGIKYTNVGVFLFSRAVTSQVSSALLSLTSVFGMGTGVPSASSTPTLLCRFPYIYIYHTLVRK